MSDVIQIFISHSSKDNQAARIIVDALRSYGFKIWYDEDTLGYGQIRQHLEESILTSQVFLALLSPDALTSLWVHREINAALSLEAQGVLIVPALIRACPVPPLLRGYRRLNFVDSNPMVELRKFAQIISEDHVYQPHETLPPAEEILSLGQRPQHSNVTNSIGSISVSGDSVNINQGETMYLTSNYGFQTANILRVDDAYIMRFMSLVEDLGKTLDNKQIVHPDRIALFLEMMATIVVQGISPSKPLLATVRAVCKKLGIVPLM